MHAAVPATLNWTVKVSITPTEANCQSTLIRGSRSSAPERVLPGHMVFYRTSAYSDR